MKNNLPYFSHDNNARNHPKMKALIAEYGYEGYGRFWALNERLAETTGACIDISKKINKLDLAKELGLDGNGLDNFLAFLSDPEIDLINIHNGIVTTDRVSELFSKAMGSRRKDRNRKADENKHGLPAENNDFPVENDGVEDFQPENNSFQVENENFQPEKHTDKIREDKNREKKIRQNSCDFDESPGKKSISKQKSLKPKKPPLREREPENDMERVEKAYIQNWDALFSQKRVETPDPIVNWNQTRALLKNYFEKMKPEQIIQAINTGLKDDFVMNGGYSLGIMLTASVLNRLVNTNHETSPDQLLPAEDDTAAAFQEARKLWNDLKINPQCRDALIPKTEFACLRTFQNYSPDEIENAIRNFHWHTTKAGEDWTRPPPYGSIYGFLKTGVARYFEDKAFEEQFREAENGIRRKN